MTEIRPVTIISDTPEIGTDFFGFDAYARTISGIIINKKNKTPLVIGIYGVWGSGKTTLMQTVKGILDQGKFKDESDSIRRCKTVWFQAWKYAKEEEILAGLIEQIFKTMKEDGFITEFKARIEELVKKINVSKLSEKLLNFVGGGEIAQVFTDPEYKKKLGFYDSFQEIFERLIWNYLSWRPKISVLEEWDDTKGALVVFIDDLDRCPRDKIPMVLETIKLFMDKPGCIFVIGAAQDIILKALKKTYEEDAVRFMDKIVQVYFNLPRIPVEHFEEYLDKKIPEMKGQLLPHLPLIIPAIQNNPRQLKHFFNNLNLMEGIRSNRNVNIKFEHLLYWSIIECVSPELKKEICDNPAMFQTLRDNLEKLAEENESGTVQDIPEELLTPEVFPQSLHVYLQNRGLVNILIHLDTSKEQILQLITLTGMVKSLETVEKKHEINPAVNTESMVKVLSGEFSPGEDKTIKTIDEHYHIDIYPVTNEQYKAFIEAGGYENRQLWSEEGLQWKENNNIKLPAFWDYDELSSPGCPIVGICYHEAEAYANWKGKQLPTEIQWERAAGGAQGRIYPWGNTFESEKCNTRESGIGKTSRVTRYPNGVSPAGCYDMSGNVWEWTTTQDGNLRILKGGSWSSPANNTKNDAKTAKPDDMRQDTIGFRCISIERQYPQ
ncbi:SUMF1/EgtB/PvdO family nonheme iron enzyme [Desulfobacterales bacterium HSG16]|nr:SUMF1/EgtB/PvdO family nonheme iron enzyme [Desulfobacterales bacterium HSG16]